jgi:hypothetical protein
VPRLGEVTPASLGMLYLNEIAEFRRSTLDRIDLHGKLVTVPSAHLSGAKRAEPCPRSAHASSLLYRRSERAALAEYLTLT